MKTATKCVHFDTGRDPFDAISPPIYQTATFRQPTASEFGEYDYTRTANPTRTLVEQQLAALEGGTHACAFSSGMAAITALTRLLKVGDHIIAGNDLYGGTVRLLDQILSRVGICVSYVDTTDLEEVRGSFTQRTKLVLVETPTNPMLRICDINALAQVAQSMMRSWPWTTQCSRPVFSSRWRSAQMLLSIRQRNFFAVTATSPQGR